MTDSIKTLTSLFTLVVSIAFTTHVRADEYNHIDQLAVKIQRTARKLLRETVHFRHTPEYWHLVNDTNEMYRLATHVHEVTHFEGNLAHLQCDVDELDRQFHHVEQLLDRIDHDALYGGGHIHGNTSHVKRMLISIEESIHHMRSDLQSIRDQAAVSRSVRTQPVPGPVHGGIYESHGRSRYGHGGSGSTVSSGGYGSRIGGFGFSFGGGSSRINIRF